MCSALFIFLPLTLLCELNYVLYIFYLFFVDRSEREWESAEKWAMKYVCLARLMKSSIIYVGRVEEAGWMGEKCLVCVSELKWRKRGASEDEIQFLGQWRYRARIKSRFFTAENNTHRLRQSLLAQWSSVRVLPDWKLEPTPDIAWKSRGCSLHGSVLCLKVKYNEQRECSHLAVIFTY